MSTPKNFELEPRVARLETSLARLTTDVQELTGSVQNLVVSVTKASGPREVDWHLLVSIGGLILAVSAIAFIPLNQKLQYAEQRFIDRSDSQSKVMESMDKKLQRETELIAKDIQTKVDSVTSRPDKELQNLGDRILSRVNA